MKKLYLLRHSKAGQTNKKIIDDHERPLTQKGVESCAEIGDYMAASKMIPEKIFASSSARTTETTMIITECLGGNIDFSLESRLYLASIYDLFSIVTGFDESLDSILLVGHNPGIHQFCMEVAGTGDKQMYRNLRSNFPPAALACFELDVQNWHEVLPQCGHLTQFVTPKNVGQLAA